MDFTYKDILYNCIFKAVIYGNHTQNFIPQEF